MTIKPLYLIIATILLALTIWFGVDSYSNYQAEKASREILEEKIIDTEAENLRLIEDEKESRQDQRKERQEQENLLDSLEDIKPTPRYDKSIDTIRNSNRIDSLFARYYR